VSIWTHGSDHGSDQDQTKDQKPHSLRSCPPRKQPLETVPADADTDTPDRPQAARLRPDGQGGWINLTDEFRQTLEDINAGRVELDDEIHSAADWLLANGKTKRDYRAYLRKWLRREIKDKPKQTRLTAEEFGNLAEHYAQMIEQGGGRFW